MVFDGEGINNGLGSLNVFAQVSVKAVFVHAVSGNGALKAPEAAGIEWKIP